VTVRTLPYRLPAPVQRADAVAAGSGIVIAGGLDAAGSSTSGVFRLEPRTGRLVDLGAVPQAFHDAAAALIGGRLFVFGGGTSTSSATVQSFDLATRRGAIAGRLPRPLSDVVATTVGQTVYLVGGYDGTIARAEIYATTDGINFRVVARLPQGLRYPAVAAADGRIVIAGGATASGPTNGVYGLDPQTGTVTRIASLPVALAHASAVAIGPAVYLVGGTDAAGNPSRDVIRIDPRTARVTVVAQTEPVADAAVAGRYIIGGTRAGRPTATVRELASARR
jgi:N-acetylneuraminic acid mutarotase